MKISNKEIALLGLLNERSMHGYEIEQEVYQRDMRYWTEISMSSIYKVLKKLEEAELVKSEIKIAKNNVTQKVNKITSKGQKILKESVAKLFTEFDHQRWDIDLAVNNINVLSSQDAKESINAYIKKLEELVNGYKELEKYLIQHSCPEFRMALARRPQFLYNAEIEWAKEYVKQFNS